MVHLRPALASQVWGCPEGPYAAPLLLWRHLKGRGFAGLLANSCNSERADVAGVGFVRKASRPGASRV
jgi:hypothetical protein